MKSIKNMGDEPAGTPIVADDVLEFHAARLLMLLHLCGVSDRIDGLTKLAKLDFFVRYPQFFDAISKKLGISEAPATASVESSMLRFHYGPWDKRYYHVLAYLKSKDLIAVTREGNAFRFLLTDRGKSVSKRLEKNPEFGTLAEQMKRVKKVLGHRSGSALKSLIYEVFGEEIADRSIGEVID